MKVLKRAGYDELPNRLLDVALAFDIERAGELDAGIAQRLGRAGSPWMAPVDFVGGK